MLPKIDIGDLIYIHDTGAHGSAMGYNYNGKLRRRRGPALRGRLPPPDPPCRDSPTLDFLPFMQPLLGDFLRRLSTLFESNQNKARNTQCFLAFSSPLA